MKVLVTGASGYLGGYLCRALLEQGYSVRAFVRRSSDLSSLQPVEGASNELELAYGDITDYHSLLSACFGCQVIFHTAALVMPWLPDPSKFLSESDLLRFSSLAQGHPGLESDTSRSRFLLVLNYDGQKKNDKKSVISVNVGGLKNVLQAFKEAKTVQKIIYTSSFFALGPTDGYVADEKQVHREKFFCTEYEKSKVLSDKIALEEASDGLPIIILYPGVIYGPGKLTDGNVVAQMMIERFNGRLPGYLGYGTDKVSFSHVEDVVNGHIAALERGRVGERYLLTGENASFVRAFDMASIITNTSKPWFHIPLWVIEIYGWISVFWARITGCLPLISYPTVRVLRHQWSYSCEKAKAELEYSPRSLKEGLEEMLPWLKGLGLIKY